MLIHPSVQPQVPHSDIRYISPAQRQAGEDTAIPQARIEFYHYARAQSARRQAPHSRNPITVITLNPERDPAAKAATENLQFNRSAA
jgi:hypothetical protein